MLRGHKFSGALPPETPQGLRHEPVAELRALETPTSILNNFVIIFHEIKHSKTQSLFKNKH